MLNLTRMRLLSELGRRGTIAATAEALRYSPSAVSQQLSLLERETGARLLERDARRVRLTPAAVELARHADAAVAELERAEADLAAGDGQTRGVLSVASFQSVVLGVAPSALDLLRERHPELEVVMTQREVGEAYRGLLAHRFDLIVGEEYPGVPEPVRAGVDREDLMADPMHLVLPPSGSLTHRPHRLADLADAPWAIDPEDTVTGSWARAVCRSAGFEPRVQFESPDPLLQAHLVRTGHAVAFIPGMLADPHLDGLELVRLPGDPHRMVYTTARVGRSGHPAIGAFRRALGEALASLRPAPAASVRV
ncbi:LysR family transcriptional regulator [Microbacterium karelineae]|uniref:LysR family transcriptional regulator n=1 Tax=Microbacterium karelineae TaxID=2654283 RepID=UPI0012EA67E7|nr:LysR family transcriptional regulator [Microbacterium karelineae]